MSRLIQQQVIFTTLLAVAMARHLGDYKQGLRSYGYHHQNSKHHQSHRQPAPLHHHRSIYTLTAQDHGNRHSYFQQNNRRALGHY